MIDVTHDVHRVLVTRTDGNVITETGEFVRIDGRWYSLDQHRTLAGPPTGKWQTLVMRWCKDRGEAAVLPARKAR